MNKRIAEFLSELCDENERLEKECQRKYEALLLAQERQSELVFKNKDLIKTIKKLKKEAK